MISCLSFLRGCVSFIRILHHFSIQSEPIAHYKILHTSTIRTITRKLSYNSRKSEKDIPNAHRNPQPVLHYSEAVTEDAL